MKKNIAILASFLVSVSLFSGCNNNADKKDNAETAQNIDYANIEKPQVIRAMTHTFSTDEETVEAIEKKYQENTGIKLEIDQVSDNNYFEVFNIAVASDQVADVVESGSVFYPSYVSYDLLYDMTNIWEVCDTKDKIDEGYVEALKINDKLYGFPISNGNGTVTYIRKDWLDECGLSMPKTYDEFIDMLRTFKKEYPDCIPFTSAGLVNTEYPYNLYLPEFYQNAIPDIYQKEDGTYVDGMREDAMKEALQRLKDAYDEGLIDADIATNKTKTCREKFTGTVDKETKKVLTTGNTGVFNYWAGNWAKTLRISLNDATGEDAEMAELIPIKETTYIERPALALIIPKYCENPEGVFKYFIEYMHDGGDGQILFTVGTEGRNWEKTSKGIETIKNDKAYYTPELSMLKEDNLNIYIDPIVENATKILMENSVRYPQPVINKEIGSMLPDVVVLRREIIEEIVTNPDVSVEAGLESYEKQAGAMVDSMLEKLNSKEAE